MTADPVRGMTDEPEVPFKHRIWPLDPFVAEMRRQNLRPGDIGVAGQSWNAALERGWLSDLQADRWACHKLRKNPCEIWSSYADWEYEFPEHLAVRVVPKHKKVAA